LKGDLLLRGEEGKGVRGRKGGEGKRGGEGEGWHPNVDPPLTSHPLCSQLDNNEHHPALQGRFAIVALSINIQT